MASHTVRNPKPMVKPVAKAASSKSWAEDMVEICRLEISGKKKKECKMMRITSEKEVWCSEQHISLLTQERSSA
jgi:hypothetical protein